MAYKDSSLIATNTGRKMSTSTTAGAGGGGGSVDGGDSSDVTTDPSKWPGVTSLRALLDREKDDETPNLNVLLCEIFVAVYMSLLSYALSSCDPQILYRLVSQKIGSTYWSHLFGGGAKKIMKVETSHSPLVKELSVGITEEL